MALKPFYSARQSPSEEISEDLARMILVGDVAPGETLPTEKELCVRYDFSRTVVREALKSLTAKGLLISKPRVGAVICTQDKWNLLDPDIIRLTEELGEKCSHYGDMIDARTILEPVLAGVAAKRAKPEDIAEIERAVVAMEASCDSDDLEYFHQADIDFHLALLQATQNIVLCRFGDLLSAAMRSRFRLYVADEPVSKHSVQLHRDLLEFIKVQDSEGAIACLTEIANSAEDKLKSKQRKLPG